MKYRLFTFFIFISFILQINEVNCQPRIMAQLGNDVTIFTNLDSALTNAENGSTVYIPGGGYTIGSNLIVNKKLNLVGTGHYPDYTQSTGRTYITGNLKFASGADSGSITGIYINGNVQFGTTATNQDFTNFSITRCRMTDLSLGYNTSNTSSNFYISENVITGSILGFNIENTIILKNIVKGISGFLINDFSTIIRNNIVFSEYYGVSCGYRSLNDISYSLFENNIFLNPSTNFYCDLDNNIFNNNIFVGNVLFPFNGNDGVDNIVNINADSIFVYISNQIFNYTNDLHLKENCPGKNAGTDGTDIGIYGTSVPYKEGAVPKYPHIKQAIIPSETENGNLRIQVEVEAQQR